jgi:transcription antitermination factor NusG
VTKKWYAIYCRPRWEKKVDKLLKEKGIESYCPLNKIRRKWSDRIKLVEEPLFKSYIFVQVDETEHTDVRRVTGVINFVYWNGKPAIVKDKEIKAIMAFLDEHENVIITPIEVAVGQKVKIVAGPLMDNEAEVLDVSRKAVKVIIQSLSYQLVAYIDKSKIENIK